MTTRRPIKKAASSAQNSAPANVVDPVATAEATTNQSTETPTVTRVESATIDTIVTTIDKKKKKQKVIRDSFTMPKEDYDRIDELKSRALFAGIAIKKSELLRAGLIALSKASDKQFKEVLAQIENIKTGRPEK